MSLLSDMTDTAKAKRYLVMLRVNPPLPTALHAMTDRLDRFDPNKRVAYASARGETFGVFLKTTRVAAQIRAALDCEYTTGGDSYIIVTELGEDWAGIGGARAWEWLQHH